MEPDPNDDHPPYDIFAAQTLIARVYNAIRANESLWNHTLLVILYDEHGGFYDHVKPPPAVAPDRFTNEFSFDRLGVRVPAILVSPWVAAGVFSDPDPDPLDHASLLRYVCDRWELGPLGARVEKAMSFAKAIRTVGAPRTDTPTSISADPPLAAQALTAPGPKQTNQRNENQQALHMLSEVLERKAAAKRGTAHIEMLRDGPPLTDSEAAAERIERFLETD